MTIFNKLVKEALEKSWINQGYRFVPGGIKFCYFVWNLTHPGNKITKGDGYIIHHKDGNKLNDDRKNLWKFAKSKHLSIHKEGNENNLGRIFSKEHRRRISDSHKGRNNPNYGKQASSETRRRLREAWALRRINKKGDVLIDDVRTGSK